MSARGVGIVTDGAAALPPEVVARWGIEVVPMGLTVDGVPEPEGARPLEDLLSIGDVRTAAPSPGEFAAAVSRCLEVASEVVVLTVAGTMSATYESARLGSAPFGPAVRVIDTRSAAGGQGLVVLHAAREAGRGADGAVVAARATDVAARVRLVATLSDLGYLARSGRVPGVAAWAGTRLGINPLFEFRDGAVRVFRPALSSPAALDRMVAHVRRSSVPDGRLHAAVLHAAATASASGLVGRVDAEFAPVELVVGRFGPVMVLHTGPGLAGVAWWWEPPDVDAAGEPTRRAFSEW